VHLSDPVLVGSDVAATGYALAQVLKRESPDLILLGQQSDDGECYSIGAVVAEHLGQPSVTQVIKLELAGDELTAERQAEYGYDTVKVKLPAVISVGDAINEPRYPSLKAIMSAKKKPLDAVSAADAGIEPGRVGTDGSNVQCGDFKAPPSKSAGTLIEDEGDTDDTVAKIIAWLDERKLLA
jgi:electron transfer flavoprotein beta subunit